MNIQIVIKNLSDGKYTYTDLTLKIKTKWLSSVELVEKHITKSPMPLSFPEGIKIKPLEHLKIIIDNINSINTKKRILSIVYITIDGVKYPDDTISRLYPEWFI